MSAEDENRGPQAPGQGKPGPAKAAEVVKRHLKYWYLLFRHTVHLFFEHRGPYQANALAYRSMISLVPMLAFMISLFTWIMGSRLVNLKERLRDILAQYVVPESDMVARTFELIDKFTAQAEAGAEFGFLILLLTSILLINGIEAIFNNIWQVQRRRPYAWRIMSYTAMTVLIPLLLGLSIYITAQLQVGSVGAALQRNLVLSHIPLLGATLNVFHSLVLPLVMVWALFLAMYKWLPNTRVETGPALVGSLVAALSFEVCKWGFSIFAARMVTSRQLWWGPLGVFLVFLVWVYLIWWIVLFCSQLTFVIQNYRYVLKKGHDLEGRIGEVYLVARTMLEVARRHLWGPSMHSVKDLAQTMEVEAPRIQKALARLIDQDLVMPGTAADKRGHQEVYLPARDLGRITVAQAVKSVTDLWQMPARHDYADQEAEEPDREEQRLDALIKQKLGMLDAGLDVSFRELLESDQDRELLIAGASKAEKERGARSEKRGKDG